MNVCDDTLFLNAAYNAIYQQYSLLIVFEYNIK